MAWKKLWRALAGAGVGGGITPPVLCLALALWGCAPPAQPAPLPPARAAPIPTAAPLPPTPAPTPTAAPSPPTPAPTPAPQALEAELFHGIVEMPQEDYARAPGWTAYTMDFYSGQRAAIAHEVGGLIAAPLALLPPGDYRVTLAVYDYGTGATNRVEITLNGVSQTLSWSGRQAGVRRISADFLRTKGGQELTIRALERGQDYIIVDQVTVKPAQYGRGNPAPSPLTHLFTPLGVHRITPPSPSPPPCPPFTGGCPRGRGLGGGPGGVQKGFSASSASRR